MSLTITSAEYVGYIHEMVKKLENEKDYITRLDAETGDGDHWANMYAGFSKLLDAVDEIMEMNLGAAFKKSGMLLMSGVGGSSGILYGSAYIGAAKAVGDAETLDVKNLCVALDAMMEAIMKRGGAKPGQKTMLDGLAPAIDALKNSIAQEKDESVALNNMKKAAWEGAQSTKDMVAMLGRAVYQANKGVGHLDPGAVTMCYQIEALANSFLK